MIVLTLLMPSMYLVSLPYIYIVYYGLFHPYHDEGPLSLLYGPYSKKNYLPVPNQAVFVWTPTKRVVSHLLNRKPSIVH